MDPARRGGGDGSLNSIKLRLPDGTEKIPRSLDLITGLPAGTIYHQWAGGGGGLGDPRDRPAARVAEEVRNGAISIQSARNDYGVVLDETSLAIDEEATSTRRHRRKN